ncbi:MAG TPA: sensor histidine kinase [Terriglobia bacterium]|nr:sensor histidine kinase [Terriglobia bacterium]
MNARSSVVLALGFGVLIALIAALGIGAIQRASVMHSELQASQDAYLETEALCRGIATDMYSAGVMVRDYLLDSIPANQSTHRTELIAKRNAIQAQLDQLYERIDVKEKPRVDRLQMEVQAYWDSLDPIFDWTPAEKAERSWVFLARRVLPHRDAVVNLSEELTVINNNTLQQERERLRASQGALQRFLVRMIGMSLLLGVVVAGLTIYRVASLERTHVKQRKAIEESQDSLRRLSQRLVQIQESERRSLSRELHDEVGQTMTALGIQLGNIEDLRSADGPAFRERLEDMKRLNADAMRTVRDLAMGLRPSMLDDLGLEAALQWQGREFSRLTGVPCQVLVEGGLDTLAEAQKTCIYRLVQEALTNCARHAKARAVRVSVRMEADGIALTVSDDGVGFKATSTVREGLGLLGMRERVQALDGNLQISSSPGQGTTINVQLPLGVPA